MPKLVKTLSQEEYLDNFKKSGEVFLQPLSHYRKIEDDERVDDVDGLRGLRMRPNEVIQGKSEDFNIEGSNVRIEGGFVRFHVGSIGDIHSALPDVYVFCVDEEHLPSYGAYNYEITDPIGFGETLSKSLTKSGKKVLCWKLEKVKYGDEKNDITSKNEFSNNSKSMGEEATVSDYFKKPTHYEKDQEWRYVFILVNVDDVQGGVLIQDNSLSGYCS